MFCRYCRQGFSSYRDSVTGETVGDTDANARESLGRRLVLLESRGEQVARRTSGAANKWRGERMARQRARQGEGQDSKFNRARSSSRRTSGAIADAATCRDLRSPLSRAPTPRVRRARPSHRGVGSVPAETRRLRNTPSGRPPRRGGGRRAGRRVPAGPHGVSDRALHSPNTRPTPILFPVPRVHFSRVSPFCNDPRQRISGAVEHAQAALRDHGLCRRLHGAYR